MSVGAWLRRGLASIALCYACAGHAQAQQSPDAEVRLMGQASVTRPSVKLADIAEIRADDAALQDRLASIDLGPAPPVAVARVAGARASGRSRVAA
ncbi:hypothetical protein [Pandoraea pneumonica]|uniref:hypothetical protein n=1 Tax=Pandoraea pneumonica TaxID=2508299 RepID=UPI003CEBC858